MPRIQLRRDTAANWTSANPTLAAGEMGVETDSRRIKIGSGSAAWTALAYLDAGPPQVVAGGTGAIADLTSGQQAVITTGTVVTTTDGRRWIYAGSGSKTAEASYIELADVTPTWDSIAGKPSTFAPSSHSHAISDVTNLQPTLDGKAATSHTHAISAVTNLQTTLDAKLTDAPAAGQFYARKDGAWVAIAVDGGVVTPQTPTFTGAVSGDWAEPGNWVGGELPAASDNAIVTAAVSSNSGEDSPTVANLTVSSNGFGILITVTGTATFSGSFLSGTIVGNAAFGNGAATTGGSSVQGNATFNGGSSHGGSVTGTATFTGSACNDGGTAGTFVPNPPPACP